MTYMLQKSENVAKNVANKNSQDLTALWKAGKLSSGWYWVEGCRDKEIYAYTSEYLNLMYRPKNSDRIIEQVPSYEEWEQLQNWADFTNDYHELMEKLEIAEYKNAELKELLKECKMPLEVYNEMFGNKAELLTKIDEVLR